MIGAVVTVVLEAAGPALLTAMGARDAVLPPALTYLRIRALAAVPVLIVAVGHGAFRGLRDTRTPLVLAVAANAVNAVLSWVLVFPAGLGIAGAAWGTLVAQVGAAAAFLVLGRRAFGAPRVRPDPVLLRRLVRASRHLFLRTAALLAGLVVATAAAARLGTVALAAHQIARELWTLLALLVDGFAIAGQALVAGALGAGRPDVARADARRLLGWGMGLGVALALLYAGLAGPLPRLFTDDAAVLAAVAGVWPVVAAVQVACGPLFVADGILMGAEDYRFLSASTIAASVGVLMPAAVLAVVLRADLLVVWWGMAGMILVRTATAAWRLRSGRWAAS